MATREKGTDFISWVEEGRANTRSGGWGGQAREVQETNATVAIVERWGETWDDLAVTHEPSVKLKSQHK